MAASPHRWLCAPHILRLGDRALRARLHRLCAQASLVVRVAVAALLLAVASHALHLLLPAPAGAVCIATGDLLLVPFSRGTAEGFTQIASALTAAGYTVHALLLTHTAAECAASLRGVRLHLGGVSASCAPLSGDGPLVAASAVRAHLRARRCDVVLSHEWWAPLAQLSHERLLFPGHGRLADPVLVTNFMGGLMWSRSWDTSYNNTAADWDYLEREGNFAVDVLVFSNDYHRRFHGDRWALLGAQRVGPNIVPLPPGVDLRPPPASPPALPVVGLAYVSVVDKRKGIGDLVECVLGLPDLDIRLEIIGSLGDVDGEDARAYVDRRLGGASHVEYVVHGPMDPTTVWAYVKQHQLLLVCPSLLENAPTTINLAVAYNIPLLYYDTGGVLEMVTPESAERTVLPPSVAELRKRVRACLEAGSGSAPVLRDIMFRAKPLWLDVFRDAVALAAARRIAQPSPRPSLAPPYAALLLDDERTTTDSLASDLAGAGAELVLLHHLGFAPVEGPALDAARHALFENPRLAGFVGRVQTVSSGVLTPAGPFFYASQAWELCGPEAPLLVRASLLAAYLRAYGGAPFRQWQFTSWLIFVAREMVLQPPYVTSSFDGCFNTRDCFASGATLFDSPRRLLLGDRGRLAELHQPGVTYAARAEDTRASDVSGCNVLVGSLDRYTLLADSAAFTGAQGHHNVRFCYAPTERGAPQVWRDLPVVRPPQPPAQGDPWFLLGPDSPAAVSRFVLHPSAVYDVAKCWTANVSGGVFVTGWTARNDIGGDGVAFSILLNGRELYARHVVGSARELPFALFAQMALGEDLVFRTSSGPTHDHDSFWLKFEIYAT